MYVRHPRVSLTRLLVSKVQSARDVHSHMSFRPCSSFVRLRRLAGWFGALAGCFGFVLTGNAALGQTPAERRDPPARPTSVPLSGRQPAQSPVVLTDRTSQSAAQGTVITRQTEITVQGAYAGSVPESKLEGPLLTLESALKMALRANLGALSQSTAEQQAAGQRLVARSELLPQVDAAIAETFQKINLRTLGVSSPMIPSTSKFNFYDSRVRLTAPVVDLVRSANLRSATAALQSSRDAARNARDLVVLAVSGTYLQIAATKASIEATGANIQTARAVYQQAEARLEAGLGTRVDVTRSEVQWNTEQQRQRSLQADLDIQKVRLARLIGLPPAQPFLTDSEYPFVPLNDLPEPKALEQALGQRADLQAAEAGVRAAENAQAAAHAEHYPSLAISSDFGAAGTTPTNHSVGVYNVTGILTVPLFEGGRIHGDEVQSAAAVRQRRAERDDLRAEIGQDVREAFILLNAAADQVQLTRRNTVLAHETLEQSRDRFLAGVADTVEVVQAEQSVIQADDDFVTAVFQHNLAKASLARALGNSEQTVFQLLRK